MRVGILHLSDIHFRIESNPISDKVNKVAAAAASDPSTSLYLIVISGDIAWSGATKEYSTALQFLHELRDILQRSGTNVIYVTVPGNHDCVLPEAEVSLRDALIQGLLTSIQQKKPDDALLKKVLEPQSAYEKFCAKLPDLKSDWNGVCHSAFITCSGKAIQVNLYNTAILSRRSEVQGQLQVPMKVITENVALRNDVALSLSIFHHSYVWLESNVFTSFRSHIERTTDIALTGHQHFQHSFYKTNSTGERVLYLEGAALQDENYPQSSGFYLLLVDLDTQHLKSVHFKWSDDIYRRSDETDWRPLKLNRGSQTEFRINESFEHFLNDTGTPFTRRLKPNLLLRDVFVYPDFVVRSQVPKPHVDNLRGENLSEYVSANSRMLFQAGGFGGKTTLAKVLFLDIISNLGVIPIFLDGKNIRTSVERRVVNSFWKAFEDQYSAPSLEGFRQLEKNKRALIIDDWDMGHLNVDGRRAYLNIAGVPSRFL